MNEINYGPFIMRCRHTSHVPLENGGIVVCGECAHRIPVLDQVPPTAEKADDWTPAPADEETI